MSSPTLSPLQKMVGSTPTDLWNDSCSISDLRYSIEHGAVGATSNPTIVFGVMQQEYGDWKDRIHQLFSERSSWTDAEITWQLIEEMAVKAAELLRPVFERTDGKKGWLSLQTNPEYYRSADRLVQQAIRFSKLAPNIQVKLPATEAGIAAIEEVTAQGVNINATVSFTVPQAVAVAEAVERGLKRRVAAGESVERAVPVCTIMVGRLDDWLKVCAEKQGLVPTPGTLDWAGVACMKRAYELFQKAGYRTRLLAAAYRNHLHWSEFIGGDLILTIPTAWQRRFNASSVEVKPRMSNPVPQQALAELTEQFEDFRRAYDPRGLKISEFDSYGATARTLRAFVGSYNDLLSFVRDRRLPNPDA
ncbi:MAG TPA: transaldolase family protein [Polyangiaceae bacterium]|nr:transaldolase family protein [Polyangiaceae bacterium]